MRFNRRYLLLPGIAAILAAVALAGVSFTPVGVAPTQAGTSPDPTADPDPTIDPCEEQECITPSPTAGKPRTHTPTAEPTEGPTDVPATNPPAPPAPTNTSTGGTQAGGVKPPSTGTGDAAAGGQPWLLIAAGAALAVFGVGATTAGLKRR